MTPEHDPAEPATDDDTGRPSSGSESLVTPAGSPPATSGDHEPVAETATGEATSDPLVQRLDSHNMLPGRERRGSGADRLFVRLIATAGIIGIGVAIAAIMGSSNSQGWLIGLVVSVVSVVLAAVLWSSRQL